MKILFIGPMGAGKTTAISAVSDIPPITTEAENNDLESHAKATTTVAMDFGEIHLDNGETVALYGIPGQERFSFMWPVLAEGAMGAILLLDDGATGAREQLVTYLDAFPELVGRGALVIGVGHVRQGHGQVLAAYQDVLRQRGLALPLFTTDVRERHNVLLLIETLIANAEVNQLLDGTAP
ncbi:GTP-binding protein [Pseudomonas sp. LRF_L74]|uniref:GTP-binding protein n=1 Tax=Pseudomonas sp. LRF_L74 TaxID=3369422 RepID=UPI003F61F468